MQEAIIPTFYLWSKDDFTYPSKADVPTEQTPLEAMENNLWKWYSSVVKHGWSFSLLYGIFHFYGYDKAQPWISSNSVTQRRDIRKK